MHPILYPTDRNSSRLNVTGESFCILSSEESLYGLPVPVRIYETEANPLSKVGTCQVVAQSRKR